jgi:hypothetical protein
MQKKKLLHLITLIYIILFKYHNRQLLQCSYFVIEIIIRNFHFEMKWLLTIGFIFLINSAIAQMSRNYVEISVLERYDKHAEYDTRFENRIRVDHTKLYGLSQGFNFTYKRKNKQGFYFKAGLGYYKLTVDKIRQPGFLNITFNSRNIDFVPRRADKVLYSTSYYYYNTLQSSVGLEKDFNLKRNLNLVVGAEYLHYYTFSQKYFIVDTYYKPYNNGSLGNGVIVERMYCENPDGN